MKKSILISIITIALSLSACTQKETPKPSNSPTGEVKDYATNSKSDNYQSGQISPIPMPTNSNNINNDTQKKVNIMKKATIETNLGNITIEFYPQDAPKTVENFQKLASSNFYDNVIFHRVIKGFMIQGGDPTGTGTGGPGYKFNDEIDKNSDVYKTGYKKGIVAMANSGPNTNGSQFFIMHADYPLPPSYTIFGKVIEGLDVVDKIAASQTDSSDKPTSAVVMKSVKLSD